MIGIAALRAAVTTCWTADIVRIFNMPEHGIL
jgi:hypothetical protein